MATAHVSGTIALMLSACGKMSQSRIVKILKSTGRPLLSENKKERELEAFRAVNKAIALKRGTSRRASAGRKRAQARSRPKRRMPSRTEKQQSGTKQSGSLRHGVRKRRPRLRAWLRCSAHSRGSQQLKAQTSARAKRGKQHRACYALRCSMRRGTAVTFSPVRIRRSGATYWR